MPPTPRQAVDVPFIGGYKQRDIPAWVDPSSQTDAVNAIWTKREAIEKRPGYLPFTANLAFPPSLPNVPTVWANDADLLPFANNLYATDSTYLYAYDSQGGAFNGLDFVSPCVATRRVVSDSAKNVLNPDAAEYQNLRVTVWEDQGPVGGSNAAISFAITDITTNAVIYSGIIDKNTLGQTPRVMTTSDGYAVCVYSDASNANIYASTLSMTSPGGSWSTPTTIANDRVSAAGVWDAVINDGSFVFALAYERTGSPIRIKTFTVNNAGVISTLHVTDIVNEAGTGFLSIGLRWSGATNRIWMGYGNVTAVHGVGFDGTTMAQTPATPTSLGGAFAVQQMGVEEIATGVAVFVFGDDSVVRSKVLTTGGVVSSLVTGFNVQLISRPFAVASSDTLYPRVYAWVGTSYQQISQCLVEFDVNGLEKQPRPVAMVTPRIAASTAAVNGFLVLRGGSCLANVWPVGVRTHGRFSAAGIIQTTNLVGGLSNSAAISMIADFGHPGRYLAAPLGNLTYVGGGLPGSLDGTTLVESGTLTDPNAALSTAANAGAGTLTATTTYSWVFVYTWRDRQGNTHRGQPSQPLTFTIPSAPSGKVDLTIPTIGVTKKSQEWRAAVFDDYKLVIEVYRNALVNAALTTNFYLSGTITNDPTAATVTYTDNVSDAAITGANALLLYTTGGVVESDMPPSFSAICTHRNRIFGVGDDLRTIWVSTEYQGGNTPVRFFDGFQLFVGALGDLTSLWSMDDKLFIASATGIAFVSGGGPNEVGQQSDLSPVTRLPSDVGVTDPRAIVVTPIGTVFRHALGLGLLDRSLSVHSDFGDSVVDLLATYPNVTGMALHPTRPEILITANNGTIGVTLVYNYRFDRWSYWSLYNTDTAGFGLINHSAMALNGAMYFGALPGRVYREKVSADLRPYYDAATYVSLTATSAWIKPGGLQSQSRVDEFQLLFTPQDWSEIDVSIGYDYATNFTVPARLGWNVSAAKVSAFDEVGGTLGTVTRMSFMPPTSQCSAFRVRFSDAESLTAPTSTTGQGPRLLGMTALISNITPTRRLPAAQGA